MRVSWADNELLEVKEIRGPGRRRRGSQDETIVPDRFLQSPYISVEKTFEISTSGQQLRRSDSLPFIALDVETSAPEAALVVLRHPSGAISFHSASMVAAMRRGTSSPVYQFRIPIHETQMSGGRRGIASQTIKAVVLKVARPLVDKGVSIILPKLARVWEEQAWQKNHLKEGWFRVDLQGTNLKLVEAIPNSPERNLLFLHGTFSNFASAFSALRNSSFFSQVAPIYGDRIYAFDHFTVSRSPQENAIALLAGLPESSQTFDVITHSRGGLVLRTLVEGAAFLGDTAKRFKIGKAVLVASPNDGTPLATPERWDKTVGWVANVLEIVDKFGPENPFLTAAQFVSEAIVWVAHHLAGDLPGLSAMDARSITIARLQAPPHPPTGAYSALVANYNPEDALWKRMLDVGVDQFFAGANDLVVPSEGGWRVDNDGLQHVNASQIGCFGKGGNLAFVEDAPVMHTNFFNRPETARFLTNALLGKSQNLSLIDPQAPLPDRRFFRSAKAISSPASEDVKVRRPIPADLSIVHAEQAIVEEGSDVFYVLILIAEGEPKTATLMATFRNARAMETFEVKGVAFEYIINVQQRIRGYIDGDPKVRELPRGKELIDLGIQLFEVLFSRQIRRLYDVARATQPDGRLSIVFTSMIDWIADLPWEFTYDPQRKNFLATSEVNFTRNVVTAVPADRCPVKDRALLILVVVAQPLGLAHLSADEEVEVIKSGFNALISHDLAEVEVLLSATPALLHQALEMRSYDILHFIGHGEYDTNTKTGRLVFEDDQGGVQKIDSEVLQQIICRRNVRLVFLNACETGQGGKTDFNRGVAPALVAGGVPAVVGNQFSVLDVSATAFARHFYWVLAHGRSLGEAAREARIAVNYSISGEAIDWAVPVLFARDPSDKLSIRTSSPRPEARSKLAGRMSRRSLRSRPRIALWDVQKIIPHLDQLARDFTQAQELYVFEAVSVLAPIGTWRREREERRGDAAYINAERVVERLVDKPRELGAERLFAFTNFPLRDGATLNLYAWDEDPNEKISIFSFDGLLDQLKPPNTLERAIANATAGFIASLPAHERGPKTCPFYYNDERDIRFIGGPLKLCKTDERKLAKHPEKLRAVNALLAMYSSP